MSTTEETPVPVVADDAPIEKTEETPAPAAAEDKKEEESTTAAAGEKRPAEDEVAEGESNAKKYVTPNSLSLLI
jgi:hypothetical protein